MDNDKALLHAERWDVYMNNKKALIKGGYCVELSGSDGNKFLWEVVDNYVVYIGIRGFNFNFFDEDEEGVVK